jgi:hypothetical protein
VAPGAGHARRLAEQVVEKDIGRAGRLRAGVVADNASKPNRAWTDAVLEVAAKEYRPALLVKKSRGSLHFEFETAYAASKLEEGDGRSPIPPPALGVPEGSTA